MSWECRVCTFLNDAAARDVCQLCEQPREAVSAAPSGPPVGPFESSLSFDALMEANPPSPLWAQMAEERAAATRTAQAQGAAPDVPPTLDAVPPPTAHAVSPRKSPPQTAAGNQAVADTTTPPSAARASTGTLGAPLSPLERQSPPGAVPATTARAAAATTERPSPSTQPEMPPPAPRTRVKRAQTVAPRSTAVATAGSMAARPPAFPRAASSRAKPPSTPPSAVEQDPIDATPLQMLNDPTADTEFNARALRGLLAEWTAPDRLARAGKLSSLLEGLMSLQRASPTWRIPHHVVSALWPALRSQELTVRSVAHMRPRLLRLVCLSPASFVPTPAEWEQWSEECHQFGIWLQKKEAMRAEGEWDRLGRQLNAVSPRGPSPAPSAGSVSPIPWPTGSVIEQSLAQHSQLQQQRALGGALETQLAQEGWWSKWTLRLEVMTWVGWMDLLARAYGLEWVRRCVQRSGSIPPQGPVDPAKLSSWESSPPLLQSFLMRTRPILRHQSAIASAATLRSATGPAVLSAAERAEELNKELEKRSKRSRARGAASATGARARGTGRASKRAASPNDDNLSSKRAKTDASDETFEEEEAEEEDGMDADDGYVYWWASQLQWVALEQHAGAERANESMAATFRSGENLVLFQRAITGYLALLNTLQQIKQARHSQPREASREDE